MAEVMGRATGYGGGKSGTLHVSAKERGVILTSTIVGGELSLAPGVALSLSTKGSDAVVACFFGDGAACEGIFHEALNLAAVWKLPVLFVCENNEWQAFVHRRDRPARHRPSGHRLRLRRGLPVALPRPAHDPRLRLRRTHAMRTITPYEAIGEALAEEMRRDATVLAFGEGIATKRHDLVAGFGAARVRNTPLAEGIIAGTAAGAAATGLRPVVDLLFAPFLTFSMKEIVNSAGKLRILSGGQFSFPMVAMAMTGAGWGVGAQHNHNVEAWFVHSPGLKVVMPSAAADFKGLMKAAIRDDNPVLFFLDVALLHTPGEVPEGDHVVPLGKAAIRRPGTDVTLVSYAKTVHNCVAAAETLAAEGISAEVIDLRSLKPWDEEAVLASVRKTGRMVVVHEASRTCGVGAEIAATVAEKAFDSLRAPVVRLAGPDAPAASSWVLEQAFVPQADAVADAARRAETRALALATA